MLEENGLKILGFVCDKALLTVAMLRDLPTGMLLVTQLLLKASYHSKNIRFCNKGSVMFLSKFNVVMKTVYIHSNPVTSPCF